MLQYIYAAITETCADCGKHVRWISKNWTDEDFGLFYSTAICKRCAEKE